MLKKVLLVSALIITPAVAQQPDPAFMQRAIVALQTQRNAALDTAVVSEAKVNGLLDDLSKANAKIKELEDKLKPVDKPEDKKK
jgi:hypothetical protein